MYPLSIRLLDHVTLKNGDSIDLSALLDLTSARELEIAVTVHTEGAASATARLLVQHATAADKDLFVDFPTPVSIDLSVATTTWIHVPYFTRFVGWFTSGIFDDEVEVSLDIVAKG